MKERIGLLVGEAIEGMPWLGTFHSIGVKMLRRHAELAGLRSDFTILDTDDVSPPDQAADPGRGPRRQALAGAPVRHDDRRLEEQGPRPRRHPRGRRPRLRQRQGPRALQGLSGPAEDAERLRFRRPVVPPDPHLPRLSGCAEGVPQALQIHPRRRVPGHQHRAIHVAAAAGAAAAASAAERTAEGRPTGAGRRPPPRSRSEAARRSETTSTSAASATTTSRSMAGAAPRSTTSCASTRIFPAPPSSGWSATTAPPPISWAPPPISSPTMRAGSARRCSPTAPIPTTPRSSSHAAWDSEEEARAVGETIEQLQRAGPRAQRHGDPRARLLPDARVRRPLRHARPQLPRHRRPALLRAPGNPRRHGLFPRRRQAGRRPRLRAHRQRAQARPWRSHRPPDPRHRARAAHPDAGGRRASSPKATS